MDIVQFKDGYQFLSNMSNVPQGIKHKGITYPSVENFFQAMKTVRIVERKAISLLSPKASKAAGRKLKLRTDWHLVRDAVMRYGIKAKFSQDPFKMLLMETSDCNISEGNYWGDSYWGYDLKKEYGENKLGNILMDFRAILKEV
jgi:ribA/ribD-fused uncharacterized protein|tara:strand:+ start:223 stop:654 length:432 start_codon:yes stop_codon:yes gene_type:complete